jgi:hypothetical protein
MLADGHAQVAVDSLEDKVEGFVTDAGRVGVGGRSA